MNKKLSNYTDIKRERWVLTDEGRLYATADSPEVQVYSAIPPEGISPDSGCRFLLAVDMICFV
ncbi:hypothetical protein SOVF_023180 [Spinacia oleracea]|nr:hypothetical protein SOVF_023180 [Spinacia oleracea]